MSDPLFSVADQIVIVSGGSRGIGRAIAEGFAQRQAHVIVTGRDEATLKTACDEMESQHQVTPMVCDVAQRSHIDDCVTQVIERFGRIDTLINVAGVNRRKPALDVSEDDYDFIVDINMKGAFLFSQAVGRQMLQQESGSQINIASLNTDRPLRNVLPYATSKAAMAQMTKALALEWGDRGVRVNALAPGFILTDLTQKLWSDETMQAWGRANTPQRRLGVPDDMVGTALFLAAPASAFMTGQILYVDGGFTAGWAWPIPE
ncbi:MAG TPA: gluconate 5-dehydrogenase [Planctomycetaceae bacterium]|nr:gluconate 5-dehydrogenase [Blastopirellula sp.]HAY80771.1 gluconate 5-dehydrogenase [Planctomycetaceae bacterium]